MAGGMAGGMARELARECSGVQGKKEENSESGAVGFREGQPAGFQKDEEHLVYRADGGKLVSAEKREAGTAENRNQNPGGMRLSELWKQAAQEEREKLLHRIQKDWIGPRFQYTDREENDIVYAANALNSHGVHQNDEDYSKARQQAFSKYTFSVERKTSSGKNSLWGRLKTYNFQGKAYRSDNT